MKMSNVFVLAMSTLILASCGSMSKKQCEVADWNQLGQGDAMNGRTLDGFERRKNDCSEHGMAADKDKYVTGFATGLKEFCTYDSGVKFGHTGKWYEFQCPSELATEFMKGYRLGKAERERDTYKEELEKSEEENRRLKNN